MKKTALRLALATLLWVSTAHAQTTQPGALAEEDVLGYLEQVISWQRSASAFEASHNSARERIFQDTLGQSAIKTMKSAFKFAQGQAGIIQPTTDQPAEESAEEQTPRQRLMARMSETNRDIATLKTRLANKTLPKPQRQKSENQLKLALAKQELYQTVLVNMANASSGNSKDLSNKIGSLAREIPELNSESKAAKDKPAATTNNTAIVAATETTAARTNDGIFSLMGDLFENVRKQRALKELLEQTTALETASRSLIKTLRVQLESINSDTSTLPIDTQVSNFRQIGAQIIPLGETITWIGTSKGTLDDWQRNLDERFESILRRLMLQLIILAITLMIPLVLSSFAKRAIKRYIVDQRRKRQANTARRIIVGVVIVFILMLNFISDFSSFATFAGFLTAGLAVALQSVLLSLVGHLFFYGRYGVRPGDRVKVANVVGDIVQIGMMRFYLRELSTTEEGELRPTGKIVAFPNSILFQPAAFYKYLADVPA